MITVEQMIAWLIIEGWIPCDGDDIDYYPATYNPNKKAAFVRWAEGEIEFAKCGTHDAWQGTTTWDQMPAKLVKEFYDRINGED